MFYPQFDPDTNELKLVQNATGSSGVVSLAFTQDKSIMVGAAYGQGQIDVWDISAEDGSLKLLKQIPAGGTLGPVTGRQDSPRKSLQVYSTFIQTLTRIYTSRSPPDPPRPNRPVLCLP